MAPRRGVPLLWGVLAALLVGTALAAARAPLSSRRLHAQNHTSNWAVIVDTSRYWFNYRHIANTLSLYRTVKRLGIPDERIVLMLADDVACNARNPLPGVVLNDAVKREDVYGSDVEVDYRGYDVTPETFVRVLTNRLPPEVPRSKRLLTDAGSNVLVFMTGHGGNEFLKFQDKSELTAQDIADALAQMKAAKRFNEVLFMVDTCQAQTLGNKIVSDGVVFIGSSALGENSYSHHSDRDVGLSVIDRFTFYTLEFMQRVSSESSVTLDRLFAQLDDKQKLRSTAVPRLDLYRRRVDRTRLTDFFGSVMPARPAGPAYDGFTGRDAEPSEAAAGSDAGGDDGEEGAHAPEPPPGAGDDGGALLTAGVAALGVAMVLAAVS